MPDYTASGGLTFGESAPVASSSWSTTARGGLSLGGSAPSTLLLDHEASGGVTFGSSAHATIIFSYTASGGLSTSGTAPFEVTFNFVETFTWDVSLGVLRNWRVEGKCQPSNQPCPPTYNPDSGCSASTMQFMMNVQAHSLTDLCERLKARNWVAPIKKIQVWSQPVNKSDWTASVDPNCNSLTTVDFSTVPECLDFTVDQDLSVTGVVGASVFFESYFTYQASGGLSSGGGIDSSSIVSSHWTYTASGGLTFGESASYSSPQFHVYVASGSLSTGGAISEDFGLLSTSGSIASSILDLGIIFGSQAAEALVPSTSQIEASCCTALNLPQILFVSHDLNRSEALTNFMRVNGFVLPPILSMMFSRTRNSWYTNMQFKGTSVDQIEQQIWNIIFEFGCLTENAILGIPSDVWGFSILVRRKGLSTGRIDITRLVLEFEPTQICTAPGALKFDFTFNTNLLTTSPSVVKTVVFLDELSSFNGVSYRSNPNAAFEVSAATPVLGAGMFDQSPPLQNVLLGI